MIELVVSDLDGTLLRKDKQTLEAGTLELISGLQERGIQFVAASGRQYPNMYRLFENVANNMYFICENGSLIMHQGKVCRKLSIERSVGMELIHDILEIEEAEVLISGERTSYILPKNKSFEDMLINVVKNDMTILSDVEQLEEDFLKISAFMEGNETVPKSINERFREKYSDKFQVVNSGNGWLDFIPLDSGKGSALEYLMDSLKISNNSTVVFGDNENDISMLHLTPNSYVMSHASENIKQYGKHECTYVDDIISVLINE